MKLTETDSLLALTTFIVLILLLMMVLVYNVFIKKKSQLLLSQQKKEALFKQELAISQVEIKEQTLNYIGQELHDDVGQKLSVARLMTNKMAYSDEQSRQQIVEEINLLIGECLQDIRNLSKVFITRQVEHFGFVESLEREINRIKRLELMEVEYSNSNKYLYLDNNHALILFRIIQESINNVIKHSKARKFSLIVLDTEDMITIEISDNGVGFDQNTMYNGSGLENMQNRAKLINSEFHIESSENRGTKITINYYKQ
ncbi:sensor histidine kinase [Chryseobacterium suipulveris]|uniref:histidine kinase n=1 Tax=Chryseobacterium suipulveris TaxID=2929800 RepID=A0ABY4BKX8_9FLAO|nr:sensor histidine kinase [Chryseobacterium suipulveris]UOE39848.1 sensor histidine kinase [Chryseobacterium suipulveris]